MSAEVSEWMRQAAAEIGEVCDISHLREPEMAEIIARHCPSQPVTGESLRAALNNLISEVEAHYETGAEHSGCVSKAIAEAESALASAQREKK